MKYDEMAWNGLVSQGSLLYLWDFPEASSAANVPAQMLVLPGKYSSILFARPSIEFPPFLKILREKKKLYLL